MSGISDLKAQTTYHSISNGNWNNDNTWDGTGIPGAGDRAIIDGHSVTVNSNADINQLTIQSSGTLNFSNSGNYTLRVNNSGGFIDVQEGSSINGGNRNSIIRFQTPYDQQLIVNGTITSLYELYFSNAGRTVEISGNGDIYIKERLCLSDNENITVINNSGGLISTGDDIRFVASADGSLFINNGIIEITDDLEFYGESCEFRNNGSVSIVENMILLLVDNNLITNNYGASFTIAGYFDANDRKFTIDNYGDFVLGDDFRDMQPGEVIVNNRAGTFTWNGDDCDPQLVLRCSFESNEFIYGRNGNQDIIIPDDNYWNLTTATSGTKLLSSDLQIKNDLKITGN